MESLIDIDVLEFDFPSSNDTLSLKASTGCSGEQSPVITTYPSGNSLACRIDTNGLRITRLNNNRYG